MTKTRAELSAYLKEKTGIPNLYFQPPATVKLKYPCIKYSLSTVDQTYADNLVYKIEKRYQIMLITSDPDNPYVDILSTLPKCRYDRHYTSDNLHHYIFEIYS